MQSRKNLVIAVVIAAIVILYFVVQTLNNEEKIKQPAQVLEVEAMVLKKERVEPTMQLPGRIKGFKVAEIRPQISGIITQRLFKEGSIVEKGDQLYEIEPSQYEAVYKSAKASMKKAQAKNDRFTELLKINAVSQQEYDEVVASLAQTEANLSIAKVNFNYTKVYAPISGHIGKSTVTQGALITNGQAQELAIITQLNPIYVDLALPSKEFINMRQQINDGLKNSVTLKTADGQYTFPEKGDLQFSEVHVSESTGTILLRALFPNPKNELLPGMFVRATLHLNPIEAILLPHEVASRSPDGTLTIWTVSEEGTVSPKTVKAHGSIGNAWLIKEGIDAGTTIVTKGFQKIKPEMPVKFILANTQTKPLKKTEEGKMQPLGLLA
ncbi:MAG: membrane fusion protein (multidrug efflux system) [Alphaproteobacteria bacterium]|jgi:membrane fusion protein (multidrug efflux system)